MHHGQALDQRLLLRASGASFPSPKAPQPGSIHFFSCTALSPEAPALRPQKPSVQDPFTRLRIQQESVKGIEMFCFYSRKSQRLKKIILPFPIPSASKTGQERVLPLLPLQGLRAGCPGRGPKCLPPLPNTQTPTHLVLCLAGLCPALNL